MSIHFFRIVVEDEQDKYKEGKVGGGRQTKKGQRKQICEVSSWFNVSIYHP